MTTNDKGGKGGSEETSDKSSESGVRSEDRKGAVKAGFLNASQRRSDTSVPTSEGERKRKCHPADDCYHYILDRTKQSLCTSVRL